MQTRNGVDAVIGLEALEAHHPHGLEMDRLREGGGNLIRQPFRAIAAAIHEYDKRLAACVSGATLVDLLNWKRSLRVKKLPTTVSSQLATSSRMFPNFLSGRPHRRAHRPDVSD
jgi:hypothetical protein